MATAASRPNMKSVKEVNLVRVEDVALSGIGADDAARAAMAMARLEDPELEVPGASLPGLVRDRDRKSVV